MYVYTQDCEDHAQIHTTQMKTWVSVIYAALYALHFELSLMAKLVPQKSGALGKGKGFLTTASCALVRCVDG